MQMDGWSYGADKTQGLRVFLVQFACWRFNFHKFPILIQLFFWEKHSQNEQRKPTTSKCPTLFRVHSSTLHEAKQYFPCVLRSREKVFEKTNVKYSLTLSRMLYKGLCLSETYHEKQPRFKSRTEAKTKTVEGFCSTLKAERKENKFTSSCNSERSDLTFQYL